MRVICGDSLDVLRTLPAASVHALVTDPPAGIAFMGKNWDNPASESWGAFGSPYANRATPRYGTKGMRDIENRQRFIGSLQPIFEECLRVLKPGAFGLVWALPRTSHWTAIALEDAGFEIRDVVVHMFGSGFPKSQDVGKAMDRAAGEVRTERVGVKPGHENFVGRDNLRSLRESGTHAEGFSRPYMFDPEKVEAAHHVLAPVTEDAKRWNGWGTALKPASEHWILVRAPLAEKTVARNVIAHGAGALNIDATRIATNGETLATPASDPSKRVGVVGGDLGISGASAEKMAEAQAQSIERTNTLGRWPANVVFSHTTFCECVGTREIVSGGDPAQERGTREGGFVDTGADRGSSLPNGPTYGTETVEVWDCIPGCPVSALDAQSGQSESAQSRITIKANDSFGTFKTKDRDYVGGFDDAGGASRFFYVAKPSNEERHGALESLTLFDTNPAEKPIRNVHPTVKPVDLMRYFARLVTPVGGTLVDPFGGSGTTGVAAILEGFEPIIIEREPDYAAIAVARMERAAVDAGRDHTRVTRDDHPTTTTSDTTAPTDITEGATTTDGSQENPEKKGDRKESIRRRTQNINRQEGDPKAERSEGRQDQADQE